LEQFRSTYREFQKRDIEIIAIGPDTPEAFKEYWEAHDLPFIGCPDPGSQVADRYYQEVNLFKLGRMPAEFIIDPIGLIRFTHYGVSMSDIPEPAELLKIIDKIKKG
jgi:peroxiredoxin Q/BCP